MKSPPVTESTRPWRFDSLTPARCRAIFVAFVLVGIVGHVIYLHHSPIDLSGDEAHYWDWSRRLGLSYYSKGPLVAYIIRVSCAIFGNTMPAVRYPAVLLAAMTSVVMYLLTLKLFKSDRLALGVALLSAAVPMFVAGSMLMTIDPPFFFCWAAATYCVCFALPLTAKSEGGRMKDDTGVAIAHPSSSNDGPSKWAWPVAGLLIGLGFLAKYAALLWLPGVILFMLFDRASRPMLRTAGPWLMIIVALMCTSPVMAWNARHDWVTFRHVAKQTGMTDGDDDDTAELNHPVRQVINLTVRVAEFIGGQIGVIGPIFFFMIGGVVYAFGRRWRDDPHRRSLQLLAMVGGFFFVLTLLDAFRGKVQINWPAPAYFTLLILAGYFLSICLRTPRWWTIWRGWAYSVIVFGLLMLPIAHDFSLLYPIIRGVNHFLKNPLDVSKVDPTVKLKGWSELGQALGDHLQRLPPGTFILCDDYQQTAETAFYTPGQPITYYAGSYYTRPKRHSQYDIWTDRRLDPPSPLIGHDAIYIGKGSGIPRDVALAFDHVEPLPDLDIKSGDVKIRSYRPYLCTGFKGMARPSGASEY